MRYYYKDENGNLYNYKSEHRDLIPITEEEFNIKPQINEEVKVRLEKQKQIAELKSQLIKYKEDVEQVDLFGMQREDYEEKKQLCANLVLQLRELEK